MSCSNCDQFVVREGIACGACGDTLRRVKPSWDERIQATIGSGPVVVSISGHPEIRSTFRTVEDRDGLAARVLTLLEEVSAEYWDLGYETAVAQMKMDAT